MTIRQQKSYWPRERPFSQLWLNLKSLRVEEGGRRGLIEVGEALDAATGITPNEGDRILEACVLNSELCCHYVAELAKGPNFRNLAHEATLKIKSSFDVSFGYKSSSGTETVQDSVARKILEIGDSPSKKEAKSGLYGSLDFKFQVSQEKDVSPQKLKASLIKNSKTLGAVAVPAIVVALGLNALGFPNAGMLENAQKDSALLEGTPSFDYEKSGETRLTKSEK